MPRVLKLTPALSEKIVGYLRAGAYIETSAAAAGISKQTLYNWLRRAADENERDPIFAKFAAAVEEAQALAEVRDIALIGKAAETQWQAAAWRLERKFPERYSLRMRHEVTGREGGPIEHKVTTDDLFARIEALAAESAGVAAADGTRADDRKAE